jgi:hypothetical protein
MTFERLWFSVPQISSTNITVNDHYNMDLIFIFGVLTPLSEQYFSYIMAISFSGGGSRSTWREPATLGKQLVSFITSGCESSAPFFSSPGLCFCHQVSSVVRRKLHILIFFSETTEPI